MSTLSLSNTAIVSAAIAVTAIVLIGCVLIGHIVRTLGSNRVAVRSYTDLTVIDEVRVFGEYYWQRCIRLSNGWCTFHNCYHQWVDERYARKRHSHDEYAPVKHDHPEFAELARKNESLVLQVGLLASAHNALRVDNRALHAQVDYQGRRLDRQQRQISALQARFLMSPTGILMGILFGGVIGAAIGLVIDWALPRSAFEIVQHIVLLDGARQITGASTLYDRWPAYGIVLACATAGMLIGGLLCGVIGYIRARRQTSRTANLGDPAQIIGNTASTTAVINTGRPTSVAPATSGNGTSASVNGSAPAQPDPATTQS